MSLTDTQHAILALITERIESGGIDILISHHSRDLLNGVVLDYVEASPEDARFVFLKPGDGDNDNTENNQDSK